MKKDYEILFTPYKIGKCEIKNRFIMSPMEPTALFDWNLMPKGFKTGNIDLLVNRAKDGVGLIIPGAVMVYSTFGRKFLGDSPSAFKGVKEFMDEIYIVVLAPSKTTGKCQLENYRGESTLTSWLKTVCLYYCYNKYELKQRMPVYEPLPHSTEKDDDDDVFSDRNNDESLSNPIDFSGMNRADVEALLSMMPNARYRNIIRLLHLEQKTHKEVAEALGMSMDNYYNKRILAEKQYRQVCRKEEANAYTFVTQYRTVCRLSRRQSVAE